MSRLIAVIQLALICVTCAFVPVRSDALWTWTCNDGLCERHELSQHVNTAPVMSLAACKLVCSGHGSLWPLPTGSVSLANSTIVFCAATASVKVTAPTSVRQMAQDAVDVFSKRLSIAKPQTGERTCQQPTSELTVHVKIESPVERLSLDVSEFYRLQIATGNDVHVQITAPTFFGARHGLETLSQLMALDETSFCWIVMRSADISDAPMYPVRALTIDTARNFISLDGLRRTIDAMSWNKLNTLHWHISDSHSFPLDVPDEPRLAQYGAYSSRQTYRPQQVDELVRYALTRGVRLLPELDGPAHAGFGWQWGHTAGLGSLVVCLNKEPWQSYCVEPPCGQMNIVNENLYDVLRVIITHYNKTFQPDMLHLGGDEVNINCWKSTSEIFNAVNDSGRDPHDDKEYTKLWVQYQKRLLSMWHDIAGRKLPIILWTSHLTELDPLESELDPSEYIIQVWTRGDDEKIGELLRRGYRLIISNHDAWYLDCGFSAWVGKGNNWCSPYKSWQTVYDNRLSDIVRQFTDDSKQSATSSRHATAPPWHFSRQVLGGSAALWSEQADDATLDVKLWPRGAALAERLWSDPDSDSLSAEYRFVHHRRRMVSRGIMAETVQPQYCHEHEGRCYIN